METQSTSLVVRDRPIIQWIIGAALVILAVLNPLPGMSGTDPVALIIRLVLGVGGLCFILLSPVLTVTADRPTQTLTLHSKSLLTGSHREIPFSQIEAIQLDIHRVHRSSSSSNNGPSYRTVVVLTNGQVVPFHKYYSNGTMDKTKKIRKLREFIGVGGSEMGMGVFGTLNEITKQAQAALKEQQEDQKEVHVTDRVN